VVFIKVNFRIATRYIRSEYTEVIEIDDDELVGMTKEEIDQMIDTMYSKWLAENNYGGWNIIG